MTHPFGLRLGIENSCRIARSIVHRDVAQSLGCGLAAPASRLVEARPHPTSFRWQQTRHHPPKPGPWSPTQADGSIVLACPLGYKRTVSDFSVRRARALVGVG